VLSECILITEGAGLRAEVGLGFVGLSGCVVAAKGDVFGLIPAGVARDRFDADLRIDRCTIAAGSAVVRMGPWPGVAPAPDRPWIVASSHTAYLDLLNRESVMLRGDAEAIAQGVVFFQQSNDAVEVAAFAEAGDEPPPSRARDIVPQWLDFWGSNHMQGVIGPRLGSSSASVRFLERPKPGRLEPADLVLDASHHPGRQALDVGAPPSVLSARHRTAASHRR
jgi:serine/threonine-protein kinase